MEITVRGSLIFPTSSITIGILPLSKHFVSSAVTSESSALFAVCVTIVCLGLSFAVFTLEGSCDTDDL